MKVVRCLSIGLIVSLQGTCLLKSLPSSKVVSRQRPLNSLQILLPINQTPVKSKILSNRLCLRIDSSTRTDFHHQRPLAAITTNSQGRNRARAKTTHLMIVSDRTARQTSSQVRLLSMPTMPFNQLARFFCHLT